MKYPNISEYTQAILSADQNFNELSYLRPVFDDSANLIMAKGDSSVVYKMQDSRDGKYYGVKCFTQYNNEREKAYQAIANRLSAVESDFLVSTNFFDNELSVITLETTHVKFPVVLMDWVDGETLTRFFNSYCQDFEPRYSYYNVKELALNFMDLAHWMCQQDFVHGDIQPNNIFITDKGQIVLLDYDNMVVPDMSDKRSLKGGNPHYIHPINDLSKLNFSFDDFSLTVIAFSLCALAINEKVKNLDVEDALVLSHQDFLHWGNSELKNRLDSVLHDPICAALFSAISKLIENRSFELSEVFSLKSRVSSHPPIYLPYKLGKNAFQIFNTEKGDFTSNNIYSDVRIINGDKSNLLMIVSYGGEIDYSSLPSDNGVVRVTDLVIYMENQKRPKANLFSIITAESDFKHLKWYAYLKPVSYDVFLAKDENDDYGLISSSKILIPFEFSSITPVGGKFYICKSKSEEIGLYEVTTNNEVKCIIPVKYGKKAWYHNDGAVKPKNLIIFNDGKWKGFDLERGCFVNIPRNIKRISSFSEQIAGVETWDSEDEVRLFNVDNNVYINNAHYLNVGEYEDDVRPFNNGFAMCETKEHKNIIVYSDGSEVVIPFEKCRMESGINCKYIFFADEVVEDKKYERGYDIEFYIFDLRTNDIHSFVYHWNSYDMRSISVKDDLYVDIMSYNMKYDTTSRVTTLDLYGNPFSIESPNKQSEVMEPKIYFTEDVLLEHIVQSHFINKQSIPHIEKYYEGVYCEVKDGYVEVIGIISVDPEFGVSSELIGYADANRCYWSYEKNI